MGALSSHEDRNHYQFLFFFCLFFFSSSISMMDTGIFLLSIIFIRYRVCCQITVIHILTVYIAALAPEVPNVSCVLHSVAVQLGASPPLCCYLVLLFVSPYRRFVRGVFILKAHQRRSLGRMITSLFSSWGSSSWSLLDREKKGLVCLFVSSSNVVAAFQTRFAAQNDHHTQHGSSNNSLPMACGQMGGFFFYMKALHSTSLKRETVCTPTELSAELCHHFTAKSVSRADLSPALPLVSARMEAHLLFSAFWCLNSPCLHDICSSHAGPLICPNTGNSLCLFSFWATCLWTTKTSICYAN